MDTIEVAADGTVKTPNRPVIPFIEGDGTGRDIWRASVRVFDAASGRLAYRPTGIEHAADAAFSADGRALIIGEPDGLVKLVAARDGTLLGVHIVGPWATELLAEGYLAVNWEASASEIACPMPLDAPVTTARRPVRSNGEGAATARRS